ncbi:SipW-dependent-type signal peptide-containing protein [Halorubrum sp. AD140]|uniref:SipW-dependent-type signal peptide-containing protein n=1 Tax=Halorubrum sp. AD140 TaxID=3050073 RepID=UPI002ACCB580|nr:SipW-dependent-type signal peptide-containing protein [Halorubrum sp. AD140]MDZ5811351.1 SipW-dependent-type signal peptide-containing protein [Halorubrum sp. AD140]
MNDDTIGLSRRKMLVGLGAVGVASAGAGLGTTAYFNDTETFENNTLTAGELDLFVHVNYSEDQGSYGSWSTEPGTYVDGNVVGGEEDGEPLSIEVSDLKPGDSGEGDFCFSIVDNPAYMWMCGEVTANDENGQTEPEAAIDNTGGDPGEGDGELADAMQVTVSYCTKDDDELVHGEEIISGSLAEVMAALDNGVPLAGDGDADAPVDDRAPFEGVESAFDDDEPNVAEQCVCFEWVVPTDVGNEIQTDSVAFDFEFYAVQSRHNDGSANPCITSREVEGFGKFAYEEDADVLWISKARNGGENTYELIVGDDNANSDTADYDFGGSTFDGELTVAYDADSGEATLELANGSTTDVSYAVSDAAGDVISIVARGDDASHLASVSNVRVNGSAPTGPDAVEADGSETVSLLIEDVDASTDWELTADVAFEGLDDDAGAPDENPAVYVEVLDA